MIDNLDGKQRNLNDAIDDRIIGGKPTTIEKHPYTIGLWQLDYNRIICGGSILSPTRALTTANCVRFGNTSEFSIFAGSKWEWDHDDPQRQIRNLSRYLIHERFDANNYGINDIAVLFWKKPLTFGANVRAIRIPASNAPLPYGQSATLTGYGYNGLRNYNLYALSLPVVSEEVCDRAWGGSRRPVGKFCAGGVKDQKGKANEKMDRYYRFAETEKNV